MQNLSPDLSPKAQRAKGGAGAKGGKNLLKKVLIGGLIGLVIGVFVFLGVNYLYTYIRSHQDASIILNPIAILALILFKVSGPIFTPFIQFFPEHQGVLLVISWVIIGLVFGIVTELFLKLKKVKK